VYPFAIGSRARARHCKHCGQIHPDVAVMLRPLRVRRIQQRAETTRREGGPGPRRARFRRRLCFCANFSCGGGCNRLSVGVSCCWRGWARVTAASPSDAACPHAKVELERRWPAISELFLKNRVVHNVVT
jgi:hypothetical protein